MYLNDIMITNFRNYETLKLQFHKGINIIYGNNAQGKTNLLEAIYVLALTKSHRSLIDNNLIRTGQKFARISGNLDINQIKTKYEVTIENKNKFLKIDQDTIRKISSYISHINVIIFYPEDLELIKGSPNVRRRYMNMELSQLYSNYYDILYDFNRLLKMRNDYIKSNYPLNFNEHYYSILTNYYIDKAVLLYRMRQKFILKLNEKAEKIFEKIIGLPGFHLKYKTGINLECSENLLKEQMQESLNDNKEREYRYKTTLIGPHRDELEFYLNDYNLKQYGSQGQQRIAILSLKLAEIEIFHKQTGHYPILLLDDVFSELDDEKKNNLLFYLDDTIQTVITTTDLGNIDSKIIEQAKLIEIENGSIKHIGEVK